MNAYQVFFKIDGYEHECLVIDESEERAIENIKSNYFGVEEEVVVYPVINRQIIELNGLF